MGKLIVGLDVSPLYTDHKVRGIGFYTQRLLKELKKFRDLEIIELKNQEEIKKEKYNLLHLPYFSPFFRTLPAKIKKPWVATIHDLIPLQFKKHYPSGLKGVLNWHYQKRKLSKARAIITDSQFSKKEIIRFTGCPSKKIKVIYLAAGREFKKLKKGDWEEKLKQKYRLPKKFILYVGDVNWNKNIPGLARACLQINKPLVIVGKQAVNSSYNRNHIENQDLVWLQKTAKKTPLIVLIGFVGKDELVGLYNLAEIYCQPSFSEGFGLPVLEAMRCSCPVVSSSWGSLPEIAGKAALLVEPRVENLAQGIKKVWENECLRKELIKKGKDQAQKFSWLRTARQTLAVYRKALV